MNVNDQDDHKNLDDEGNKGSGSGESTPSVESLEAKIAELTQSLNEERSKAKEAIETRDKVKNTLSQIELDKAKKEKDIEKLQAHYNAELEKSSSRITELESERRNTRVKEALRKEANEIVRSEAFEDFWALHGKDFEVADDGTLKLAEGFGKPQDKITQIVGQKVYLAHNSKLAGGGVPNPGKGLEGNPTKEQLEAMSEADYIKTVSKNPELVDVMYPNKKLGD